MSGADSGEPGPLKKIEIKAKPAAKALRKPGFPDRAREGEPFNRSKFPLLVSAGLAAHAAKRSDGP